jgi:phosphinothricin acetyltransferase
MKIRDATHDDLPALTALYNELIDATTITWSEAKQTVEERASWFDERRRRGFPVIVAVVDGEVVGMATYGDFRDSIARPGYRFTVEHSVSVFERCWGRGLGRALMDALLERARAAGIHVMVGGIDGANTASLDFHERLGFREVARMPETGWKHGRWCDLVLVQRYVDGQGAAR